MISYTILASLLSDPKVFYRVQRHLFNHGFHWAYSEKELYTAGLQDVKIFIIEDNKTLYLSSSERWVEGMEKRLTVEDFFKLDLNNL